MNQFKKLLAFTSALTLAGAISAQVSADTTPVAPEVVKPVKELVDNGFAGKAIKFAEALSLTEEQKASIETALMEIRANLPAKDSVTEEEYIDAQVAAREAAKTAIDGVLTAEQKELLLTLQTRAHKQRIDGPKPPVEMPVSHKPVKPVDSVKPVVKPIETNEPVDPTDGVKPVKPVDSIKPVKPVDATKPVKPVDGTKPVDATKPVKPVDGTKPVDATKPVKPVDGTKPVDVVKPVKPVKPTCDAPVPTPITTTALDASKKVMPPKDCIKPLVTPAV